MDLKIQPIWDREEKPEALFAMLASQTQFFHDFRPINLHEGHDLF